MGIDVSKATLDIPSLPDAESWTVTNDDVGSPTCSPPSSSATPPSWCWKRRLATGGSGAARPLDRNDTPEGRARNRWVELTTP